MCFSGFVRVGGWTQESKNAPNESEMMAALFIGSHHLWCYWMCQFDIHTHVSSVLIPHSHLKFFLFTNKLLDWQPILQAQQHAIYWVHKFKPNYLMFSTRSSILFAYQIHFHLENHRLLLAWKFDTSKFVDNCQTAMCVDCGTQFVTARFYTWKLA